MDTATLDQVSHDDLEKALKDASAGTRAKLVMTTVGSSTPEERTQLAKTAIEQLTPDQLAQLRQSTFPTSSTDRMWVYVAGFAAAALVVIGVALVAWGAASEKANNISNSIVVLGTGFTSAMLGGLLGAYKGGD